MAMSRMERNKLLHDELEVNNKTISKNETEKKKLQKHAKKISNSNLKGSQDFTTIVSKNTFEKLTKKNILSSLNTDKLYSAIDSDKLKEAITKIKSDIKPKNVEKTEIAIIKRALEKNVDATSIISQNKGDKNSVTSIIREIEKGKEQKEISLERDKIALENLRKQVNKQFDHETEDSKDMYGEVFDESTMERIKEIKLQKLAEVHTQSAWLKITLTFLLLLSIFFITIIIIRRTTGGN